MASVDSFNLFLNQKLEEMQSYNTLAINVLSIIGAWYTIKHSVKFGYWFLSCARKLCIKRNFVKEYGRWAVITGCTNGIGKAFMHKLAERGLNIILVSRNKESLEEEARFIENAYGVKTLIIVQDLAFLTPEITEEIKSQISRLDIGILINNAGVHYDCPMKLSEVETSRLHSMVQVNMNAVVAMTSAVLPGMEQRKRGLIVNMSSGAGWLPMPMISLYSSTKAFVDYFSQSLHYEVASSNIHVQSLTPMYIATRMTDYSTTLNSSRFFTPTPDFYVKYAIRTFGSFRSNTGYFPHALQYYIMLCTPRFLYIKVGHWMQNYLSREAKEKNKKSE